MTAAAALVLLGATLLSAACTAPVGDLTGAETARANKLVDQRCTRCHRRDVIERQRMGEAGWQATVQQMVGRGAKLNAEEQQLVIRYLTAKYPQE